MRTTTETTNLAPASPVMAPSFWRRTLTVASLALAACCALAAPVTAQAASTPKLKTQLSDKRQGVLIMNWSGAVSSQMADEIKRDFEKWRGRTNRIQLKLSAQGQSVRQAEQVIQVLRDIKRTHTLETLVEVNGNCWSMCVYVYAQGDVRYGALTSTWQFTQVAYNDQRTNKSVISVADSDRFVSQYLEPAGISKAWLTDLKAQWNNTKYWQTGGDLVQSKSGLITKTLGNRVARKVVPASTRTASR